MCSSGISVDISQNKIIETRIDLHLNSHLIYYKGTKLEINSTGK